METTITFVLGIVAGLLAVMLIGSFIGVLKMRKEVAGLKSDIHSIHQSLNEIENSLHHRIDEENRNRDEQLSHLRRDVDNNLEDTHRVMGANHSDAHQRIDEVSRYIDSRIDKTFDGLCLRMDTMFVQKETDTTLLKS